MSKTPRFASASAFVLFLATAASVHAQSIKKAPAFSGVALVAPQTEAWATNGGDWYNRRWSPSTALNRDNVAQLKGVWRTHLRGSGLGPQYSGEAQPLVYRGVAYVSTGANDVFAVSIASGEILWEYRSNLDPANDVVCCGWTSRGVALGDGKVYVGQLDGKLVALDQRSATSSGRCRPNAGRRDTQHHRAPLYYDGLVITGFAGGRTVCAAG